MARIRTIKPEFWSDEKLSECSLSARLLFIGTISFADDDGRLENSPVRLRMQIFPCGTVRPKQFTEWLGELTERSLIRQYAVDGKEFIDIPGFAKHQKINRPTASRLPPYLTSTHGNRRESSVSPTESRRGNGMDSEGNGRDPLRSSSPVSLTPSPPLGAGPGSDKSHRGGERERETPAAIAGRRQHPTSDSPDVTQTVAAAAAKLKAVT